MTSDVLVIVAAHNEADRIEATLAALTRAFPGASLWVADDGSTDATAQAAEAAGARVVRSERTVGKGGAVTLAARAALAGATRRVVAGEVPASRGSGTGDGRGEGGDATGGALDASGGGRGEPVVVLCDGDLGDTATQLRRLVEAVERGEVDLAVAAFVRRVGGGMGLAVGFARWAIRRRCGLTLRAPISGQRAMRVSTLEQVLPFARGFGMEIGMTIDATRGGARVGELDLDLSHRSTGRTPGGFLHRGRQLLDFVRVYAARR